MSPNLHMMKQKRIQFWIIKSLWMNWEKKIVFYHMGNWAITVSLALKLFSPGTNSSICICSTCLQVIIIIIIIYKLIFIWIHVFWMWKQKKVHLARDFFSKNWDKSFKSWTFFNIYCTLWDVIMSRQDNRAKSKWAIGLLTYS